MGGWKDSDQLWKEVWSIIINWIYSVFSLVLSPPPTPPPFDDLKCFIYVLMMFLYQPCLGWDKVLSCKWARWPKQEVSFHISPNFSPSVHGFAWIRVVTNFRKRKSRSRSRSPGSRKRKSRSRSRDKKKGKKRSRSRERKRTRSRERHRSRSKSKDRAGRYKPRRSPM